MSPHLLAHNWATTSSFVGLSAGNNVAPSWPGWAITERPLEGEQLRRVVGHLRHHLEKEVDVTVASA
jgi:hypothetical protein